MPSEDYNMKIKTIKKALASKFNAWANSITDESLRKAVMENTIITGGSIVSMLLGEDVNDFDLYFRNYDTCLRVAQYYAKFFPSGVQIEELDADGVFGPDSKPEKVRVSIRVSLDVAYQGAEEASDESPVAADGKDPVFKPVYMSSNAITLSDKIQIVVRFFGEPEQIHASYDFVHCTCHWKSWDGELVTPVKALTSMMSKELIYVGSKYPLCSIIRIRKFIARKWTISAGQMLKMILQLNELNLTDIKVLQDQLVGVDSAYFVQLLEALKDVSPEKMTAAYISEIIDRIF
jgi:hypothetical protein